ncbi:MAG TPA: catalase family protein [Blastocatellia bacterium]|nr:catalase family protein [Blastocatellia bacterium]
MTGGTAPGPAHVETLVPQEERYIEMIASRLKSDIEKAYAEGSTLRDAHPKNVGCVKAEFTIDPDLRDELRVGLFKEPRTYPAYIRFSNASAKPQADKVRDIRGMAIKLLGVEGEKLLEAEKFETTQDFLVITVPRFLNRDVVDFYAMLDALGGGGLKMLGFFFNPFDSHLRVLKNLATSLKRHASLLESRFWSTTPYQFGPGVVKYSVIPRQEGVARVPKNPSKNYLRDEMKRFLAERDAQFDFLIQFQTDARRMPVEDAGVRWDEKASPFIKVATIRIPRQEFDSPERMEFAENLSFTPWHSLVEHRPLGSINRARKVVYEIISTYRHERNQEPRREPTVEQFYSDGA